MISKVETIRGTYNELKDYCNSIIKSADSRGPNMQVGDKFYLLDNTFDQIPVDAKGFTILPYVEVIKIDIINNIPDFSIKLKNLWIFIAASSTESSK